MCTILRCTRSHNIAEMGGQCGSQPPLTTNLNLDIKQLLVLDVNIASDLFSLWWGFPTTSAIDLASSPFRNISLAEPDPAVATAIPRGSGADVHTQLFLC